MGYHYWIRRNWAVVPQTQRCKLKDRAWGMGVPSVMPIPFWIGLASQEQPGWLGKLAEDSKRNCKWAVKRTAKETAWQQSVV